jgi:serine phosphatase RsbU (regulator of sigma subunit)
LLGIVGNVRMDTVDLILRPNDQLVFYTDGVYENPDPRLDPDDLVAFVGSCARADASATLDAVVTQYDDLDQHETCDDLAVLVVRVR